MAAWYAPILDLNPPLLPRPLIALIVIFLALVSDCNPTRLARTACWKLARSCVVGMLAADNGSLAPLQTLLVL